ncbi:MAG TPA: MaoC/PaaZ C-terminal domain-containing protein [Anaeromyxobacter sp.]|nr:MaoC/PaaZ C-terminal domain-containing protein [Anaeromyxobacter sp.]
MLTARQLYFEAVKVGDELPPLVKPPIDRLQIARYAGASQDWNPLSVDEQHARNAGFPSVLVPAMVSMGFLGELVTDWVRGARLRKFQARFVKIVWPGDVLTSRGRVVDRRFEGPGRYVIDVEAWAENQRGELVVRGLATFQLYYSQDDEARQRGGQPPLVVTREEEEARLAKLSRAQPPKPPPASRPLAPPKPAPAPPQPRPGEVRPAAAAATPSAPVRAAPPPAKPAPAKPAPAPAASRAAPVRMASGDPSKNANPHRVFPAAKRSGGAKPNRAKRPGAAKRGGSTKAKLAARHAAKRPAHKEKAARTRSAPAARKPSGKKRR